MAKQQRGIVRTAVMFLLREYIETTGAKYTDYVANIGHLRDDEVELRSVYEEHRDVLKGKLEEAKEHLERLQ